MSNDPGSGGEQPRQGQPYGAFGQPEYPSSYPPPGGYGQAPPPWAPPQNPRGQSWPGQYPGHGPAGAGPGGVPSPEEGRGVASALFDLSFSTFATPVVIRVLYILVIVLTGLFVLGGVIAAIVAFTQSPVYGLFLLLGVLVGGLVVLVYARVLLELNYAVVRMAEDVRALRNRQ